MPIVKQNRNQNENHRHCAVGYVATLFVFVCFLVYLFVFFLDS